MTLILSELKVSKITIEIVFFNGTVKMFYTESSRIMVTNQFYGFAHIFDTVLGKYKLTNPIISFDDITNNDISTVPIAFKRYKTLELLWHIYKKIQ